MISKENVDKYMSYTFWELEVWQYMVILLIGIASKLFLWLFFSLGKRLYRRNEEKLKFFKKLSHHSFLCLSIGIISFLKEPLGLFWSSLWAKVLLGLHIIFSISFLLWVNNFINFLFVAITQRLARAKWDKLGIVYVLKSVVKVAVMSLLTLLLLRIFIDYELQDWLRIFSIGAGTLTAIVAFASRDFIANFFGALVITIGRPFQVGDWIVIKGIAGRVMGLDMRSTKLKTEDSTFIYIPNSYFTNSHVQNYGAHTYAQLSFTLSLHEVTAQDLTSFLVELKALLKKSPKLYAKESKYTTEVLNLEKMKLFLYLSFVNITAQDKVTYMKALTAEVIALAKKGGITLA